MSLYIEIRDELRRAAIEELKGNIAAAADLLGVTRTTLYHFAKKKKIKFKHTEKLRIVGHLPFPKEIKDRVLARLIAKIQDLDS